MQFKETSCHCELKERLCQIFTLSKEEVGKAYDRVRQKCSFGLFFLFIKSSKISLFNL